MKRVLLLASPQDSAPAHGIADQITSKRLPVGLAIIDPRSPVSVISSADRDTLVVGLVGDGASEVLTHLAYALGAGHRIAVLILSDQPALPSLLRSVPAFHIRDSAGASAALTWLSHATEAAVLDDPAPQGNDALLSWLADRPERASDLSPYDFGRLVGVLLRSAGFEHSQSARDADDVFTDMERRIRFLVECKRYHPGHRLHIEDARSAVSRAVENGCDFILFATHASFTPAAAAFAASSVPPVWHLDQEFIARLLKAVLEKEPDRNAVRGRILDAINQGLPQAAEEASVRQMARFGALLHDLSQKPFRKNRNLFLHFSRRDKDSFLEARAVFNDLRSLGFFVWHDLPDFETEHYRGRLDAIRDALQESATLFIFDAYESVGWEQRDLDVVSLCAQLDYRSSAERAVFIVTRRRSPWNRLRYPSCFQDPFFVDAETSTWRDKLLRLLRGPHSALPANAQGDGSNCN
jgi:hypothetical protein